MKQDFIEITGITCINCQNRIQAGIAALDGVRRVSVDYKTGQADVEYDENVCRIDQIGTCVTSLGYQVVTRETKKKKLAWKTAIVLLITFVLYVLLERFGILNLLVPSKLADQHMGYGMLFVVGVLTSFHCIAMCGGIQLSQCIGTADETHKKHAAVRASLAYNLGRILGYTFVGAVLGGLFSVIGHTVNQNTLWQCVFKAVVGICMIVSAGNLIGLFPALRRLRIPLPRGIYRLFAKGNRAPFFVGMVNSLMPCGPLQAMWMVALATGNVLTGVLSMFFFAVGTVPMMLGVGTLLAGIGRKYAKQFTDAGAVVVAVMGFAMLSQGAALSGYISEVWMIGIIGAVCLFGIWWNLPMQRKAHGWVGALMSVLFLLACYIGNISLRTKQVENQAYVKDGVQYVHSELSSGKYPDITVQAGMPVEWVIDAPEGSINGCNYKIISRSLPVEHEFTEGENIITFEPEERGVYEYTCWMGMIKANIIVE